MNESVRVEKTRYFAIFLILMLPILVAFLFFQGVLASIGPADQDRVNIINVTTTTDELNNDGDCSLREAIESANKDTVIDNCLPGGSGSDVIVLYGTYLISIPGLNEDDNLTGDLDIYESVTILGVVSATTIIDGGGLDRIYPRSAGRECCYRCNTLRGQWLRHDHYD